MMAFFLTMMLGLLAIAGVIIAAILLIKRRERAPAKSSGGVLTDGETILPPLDLRKPELAGILGLNADHQFSVQQLEAWRKLANKIPTPAARRNLIQSARANTASLDAALARVIEEHDQDFRRN